MFLYISFVCCSQLYNIFDLVLSDQLCHWRILIKNQVAIKQKQTTDTTSAIDNNERLGSVGNSWFRDFKQQRLAP